MQLCLLLFSLALCAGEFDIPKWDEQQELNYYEKKYPEDPSFIGDHKPLHLAAVNGRLDMVKYCIEQCKENINGYDNHVGTPLMAAIENNHFDIVEYLINKDCSHINVLHPRCDELNPLIIACDDISYFNAHKKHRDIRILKILLQKGADVNINGNGSSMDPLCTPLGNVIANSNSEALNILLNYLPHIQKEIALEIVLGESLQKKDNKACQIVRQLLLYGVALSDLHNYKRFIFSDAHYSACRDVVCHLRFSKIIDEGGNTPLFYAATQRNKRIFNFLLNDETGNFNKNNHGKNILWYISRILHRKDLSDMQRQDYEQIHEALHKKSWGFYQANKGLRTSGIFPQEVCSLILNY